MRIREELGEVYPDARFAAAFGVRGRPGISPGQLMVASVLQFSENLTDRQAADAVRDRMTWKYALGLELKDPGFVASVLSEFRSRLVAGDLTSLALDALLERLAGLVLVKAGGRQRTDSTHVLGAIRELNRLELAGETLRATLEALAVAAPGWLAAVIDAVRANYSSMLVRRHGWCSLGYCRGSLVHLAVNLLERVQERRRIFAAVAVLAIHPRWSGPWTRFRHGQAARCVMLSGVGAMRGERRH